MVGRVLGCLTDSANSRRAVTPKTKMIVVNTPHNPVGKVFTREELEKIAEIAKEHNLLVMADEVVRIPSLTHVGYRQLNIFGSMRPLHSMVPSTFESQIYQGCGNVRSQWDLREVRRRDSSVPVPMLHF